VSQTVRFDASPRAGALNGKWVLGRVLVSGDTATVYEATHRVNGRRVSVRILHATLTSSPEALARFQRDALVANKVGHPGSVQVLDDDVTEDGSPFLVMERLEGDSLANVVKRAKGAVTAAEVVRIAYELLAVLAAAHANGIVHRNVRPESVFLTSDGKVKLMDFGLASVSDEAYAYGDGGAPTGTPAYMSPERARGRWADVDARTDIWAVGAIMFRLFAGRPVRALASAREQLAAAAIEPAPSLRSVGADAPAEIAEVVERALAFDREARWPDARSMQHALEALAPRLVDRPALRTLDFSPSRMPSLRFRIETINPSSAGRRVRVGLAIAGMVLCATASYGLARARLSAPRAQDVARSETPNAAAPPSRPPQPPREVELAAAAVEPASSVVAEPFPLPKAHRQPRGHSSQTGVVAPDDRPASPETSAPDEVPDEASSSAPLAPPSVLDRRH
jgi:serine/threonine protein kinase